jgi:PleD family two-component response regulator
LILLPGWPGVSRQRVAVKDIRTAKQVRDRCPRGKAGPRQPRIAIIDDEPRTREVIAMLLGRERHHVETFESGNAFAKVVVESSLDLLMADLKMRGMSSGRRRKPHLKREHYEQA